MGKQDYKAGQTIAVVYQAANSQIGLNPLMQIFDETRAKDLVNFADVVMLAIAGAPGRYLGTFTPDIAGEWMIIMDDGTGKGKTVVSYSVGGWNVNAVGQDMAKEATVAKDATVAKAAALATVAGKADDIKAAVDAIAVDINTIEIATPPMIA